MELETAMNSLDPVTTPEPDLAWFRTFVAAWPWRFAKTYVESYPHEYTLERQGDPADFQRALRCIERWGVVESFWGAERKYFYVDDRKYWFMGNPASEKPEDRANGSERGARAERGAGGPASERVGESAGAKLLGTNQEQPTLINRTWLDVTRYRENARTLGYDEQNADKLAERWKMLLERARRAG